MNTTLSQKDTKAPNDDEYHPICNAGAYQCHKVQFRATLCKGGFAATCKVFVPISSMLISSLQIVTNILGNGVNIKHGRIFLANGDRLFGSVINCMFFAATQCSDTCNVSIPTSWLSWCQILLNGIAIREVS